MPAVLLIHVGDTVCIDPKSESRRRGTVQGFLRDMVNGDQHAIVELDGTLPGVMEQVPVSRLSLESKK